MSTNVYFSLLVASGSVGEPSYKPLYLMAIVIGLLAWLLGTDWK